ncbi:MAG TPA: hypothetical protein VF437_06835 [Verrucomicrobiae bacterium]
MRNKIFQRIVLPLALMAAFAFSARAQMLSSNRWLIIADTSFSMGRRDQAMQVAVQNMLLSGMSGQLRRGDTIGLWIFNDDLYTGRFPLQIWMPEGRQTIALRVMEFLKRQRYEKDTRFDKVITAVNRLAANSDTLTVILITDGDEKIAGTPFDKPINASFKQDHGYQKKVRAPFIVALRAQGGKLVDYTVTLAPWPVKFPPLPPEPAPAVVEKIEPPAQPTPAPAPKLVVPSLILSGEKSEPVAQPEPTAPPVEKPAAVTLNPEPVVSIVPPTTVETKNAAAVSENPPAIAEPPTKVDAAPQPAPTPPVALLVAEVKPLVAPPVPPAPKTEAQVVVTSSKENVFNPLPNPPPQAAPPVQPAPKVEVTTSIPNTKANILIVSPAASTPQPAPVQVAVVTSPATNSGNQKTLLIGLALLVAALAIGILWLRRSRQAPHASLITRSLDKDK